MNGQTEKTYARDGTGRVGEVMGYTNRNTRVWLRPPLGGYEWDVAADSVTPCDRDGNDLPATAPGGAA